MSVHLSEEEQLEVLKRWWKDYGRTVLLAVVVVVGGYFSFTAWQDHKRTQAEEASVVYEQLLKLVVTEQGKTLSDSDKATAMHLAGELKAMNDTSLYAHSAAFFMAKIAVEDNKLDAAVSELNWILSAKPDTATEQLARLRLARVLTAQQAYEQALAQLTPEPAAAFVADYAEARGDIFKLQGDLDAARSSFEKALTSIDPAQQERYMLLQMKVDDLKVNESLPAAAVAEEK